MKPAIRLSTALFGASAMTAALLVAPAAALRPSPNRAHQRAAERLGETTTRLSDGRWLIVGGERAGEVIGTARLVDPATGAAMEIALPVPRAWHTATVLADGTVLIAGGAGAGGQLVAAVEVFDPQTATLSPLAIAGAEPRSGASATLLTDGRVLVAGGRGTDGRPVPVEVWDVARGSATSLQGVTTRNRHNATLLADGRVLLSGGQEDASRARGDAEIIDPATGEVTSAPPPPAIDPSVPQLAASLPSDAAQNVDLDVRIALRFSKPVAIETLARAVSVTGPDGAVDVNVVSAEGGRLAFVAANALLAPETTYAVSVQGASDDRGVPIVPVTIAFATKAVESPTTRADLAAERWLPDPTGRAGWRTDRPDSPWRTLPPLMAPEGVTAISGQVLRLDGRPLPDVTLEVDGHEARSDRTGRFLLVLADLPGGRHELEIDGRTANRPNCTYGTFEYGLDLAPGKTTVLAFTIWMPLIDTAHQVAIASPTGGETVITTPYIPGLELHLPAGTVITDDDGNVVRAVSITPIPVDRPPFPLAPNVDVPIYFTIQPGGAYMRTPPTGAGRYGSGAWLVYPNFRHEFIGKRIQFFHYNPDTGWYVYGLGTVLPGGAQIRPDAKTRIHAFTGAMINSGPTPPDDGPPPGDCCGNDGDPVNLATGLFSLEQTDLYLPDTLPVAVTRTYRTRDQEVRPFGPGTTHPYAMFLYSANQYTEADLVLPDGAKLHYIRTSGGEPTSFVDAVFEHIERPNPPEGVDPSSATPTAFYRSVIRWNGRGWNLTLKDGTVYVFGENAPLQAIRDRFGNTVMISHAVDQIGNVTRVTSPHGRWIAFTYGGDPNCNSCISQITDNIGRTVGYHYDTAGNLWKVTDPLGHVTEYTYNPDHNMVTVKNRNGVVYVTNDYTTSADLPTPVGWVKKQTHADGGVYEFTYNVVDGKSTQTVITDPREFTRRVTFNADGFTLADTRALGTSEQKNETVSRPNTSNFISTSTDNLLRQTAHSYDPFGNETSITRLAGTGNESTTTDTFDPVFNQVTSTTDPLTHTTTFEYDAAGNLTAEVDPLNHRTTYAYNTTGQLISTTDALEHTSTFTYAGGDVKTVQDPLGRLTTRFVDAAGRIVATTDPIGRLTKYEHDALDRLTKRIDPSGAETFFTYFPEGQLESVTDALNHTTSYTYDSMGRPATRTDALGRTETLIYDGLDNLTEFVDRSGRTTTRTYDSLNRLQRITYADGSTITYTYDGDGRLATLEDSTGGTITRAYDDLDRLVSETTSHGSVSYTYDAAGRRATLTVTGQPPLEYEYDDGGRLATLTQGTAVVTLQYDDANRRTSLTLPNGIVTEYTYDAASQLIALTYKRGQTIIGDLTYTYDLNGNRVAVGGTFARTALPQAISNAAYDAANQLIQWSAQTLSYDANGNLRSDGLTDYFWNARQQLVGLNGPVPTTYGYDPDGRRVERTLDGTTTTLLHAGAEVVQEEGAGAVVGRVPGRDVDEWWSRTEVAGPLTPLVDAQGSSIALADGLGALVTQYTYEPFGRAEVTGAATANRFAYTGRETEQDARSGLYYYRARYYDANAGRFISQDPLGISAGVNGYQYVGNNPINSTDPGGLYTLRGFPPARHAQMKQAIRQLYTKLKQTPCCIAPALRDRVLELIHPGENGAGVTFQYRNVIPVPSSAPSGVVVCGFVNGWSDFLTGTAQISRAAMDGTCDCPLPGTILHEVVHLTYSNFLTPWSAERKAYAAAEACFGPDCGR